MKILSIMQPTYMPWLGYFNLMATADRFVFLDDVQFSKQSWQQRQQIMLGAQPHWLTVPVLHEHGQFIRDVLVDETQGWRATHLKTVQQAYGKLPHGREVCDLMTNAMFCHSDGKRLADINQNIILAIVNKLGIRPLHFQSSTMVSTPSHPGTKSGRLIDICRGLGCGVYLSPQGARDYIESEGLFSQEGIEVVYQQHSPNWPHLSILDTIARLGYDETRELVLDRTPSESMGCEPLDALHQAMEAGHA